MIDQALLNSLGLTQDELQNRVVQMISSQCLTGIACDEDGEPHQIPTGLKRQLDAAVREATETAIKDAVAPIVDPILKDGIENVIFEKTNQWGETKPGDEPKTFKEFVANYIEEYLKRPVDSQGRSEKECRSRGNSFYADKRGRLMTMLDSHLHWYLETAVKNALKDMTGVLGEEIGAVAKRSFKELAEKLKVQIKAK